MRIKRFGLAACVFLLLGLGIAVSYLLTVLPVLD